LSHWSKPSKTADPKPNIHWMRKQGLRRRSMRFWQNMADPAVMPNSNIDWPTTTTGWKMHPQPSGIMEEQEIVTHCHFERLLLWILPFRISSSPCSTLWWPWWILTRFSGLTLPVQVKFPAAHSSTNTSTFDSTGIIWWRLFCFLMCRKHWTFPESIPRRKQRICWAWSIAPGNWGSIRSWRRWCFKAWSNFRRCLLFRINGCMPSGCNTWSNNSNPLTEPMVPTIFREAYAGSKMPCKPFPRIGIYPSWPRR